MEPPSCLTVNLTRSYATLWFLELGILQLLIRIPRDACQFYEFWRASELIEIGLREAEKALDAAGF